MEGSAARRGFTLVRPAVRRSLAGPSGFAIYLPQLGCFKLGREMEGVMKKTGKSGLGHLKKMERQSRQMLTGRLAMAAAAETKKIQCKARRRCA